MFAFAFVIALMVLGGLVVVAWGRRGSTEGGARMARAMVTGAFWAVGLAFPLAAACALVYRFPVPMAGYANGPTSVPRVLLSVVFYGLLGGFPALLAAGAAAGGGGIRAGPTRPAAGPPACACARRAGRGARSRHSRDPRQADRPLVTEGSCDSPASADSAFTSSPATAPTCQSRPPC